MPTLVQGLAGHKIVGVELGSGDAHTLALEDSGKHIKINVTQIFTYKTICPQELCGHGVMVTLGSWAGEGVKGLKCQR